MLEYHIKQATHQRTSVNKMVDELKEGEAVVIMDFKENWRLPISNREASRDYYDHQQISHFCVFVFKRDGDFIPMDCYNFFSHILSHNFLFVQECLSQLSVLGTFDDVSSISFVSDTGPHFRNGMLLHFLFRNANGSFMNKVIRYVFLY